MAQHGEQGYEFRQELNAFVEIPYSKITVNMLKLNTCNFYLSHVFVFLDNVIGQYAPVYIAYQDIVNSEES